MYVNKNILFLLVASILIINTNSLFAYKFQNLGVEKGLSNNYITDIEKDELGYVWIATESGLNKFDGKSFKVFNKSNSSLVSNSITSLLYDSTTHKLWIGTQEGLDIYDCYSKQFENYIPSKTKLITNISDLSLAGDSGIWITDRNLGITYFNKKINQFLNLSELNLPKLDIPSMCIFDDGEGLLYVGHSHQGLSIINLKNRTFQNFTNKKDDNQSLPGNRVYCVSKDHLGNIWIGTNQGLALYNMKMNNFLVFKNNPDNPYSIISDHIYDIKKMNNNTLWIASDIGGISILDLSNISFMDPKKVKFNNISSDYTSNGTSSGNIRNLLQDKFGNIWIGNFSSGLDFISHTQPYFKTLSYSAKNKTEQNKKIIGDIYADETGKIWVGSINEIAEFKDLTKKETYSIYPYLTRPFGQVIAIEGTSQGDLLLGIFDDGFLKFNKISKKIERIKLNINNIDILTFYEDKNKKIWIGSEYGIYSYKDNKINLEQEINNQLPDKSVYGILHDRQGKLWIATFAGGIIVLDKDFKRVNVLNKNIGFCSNSIVYLYLDSKGTIWASTKNGLACIPDTKEPNKFIIYDEEYGLNDSFVRAIQEDNSGNIWISTYNGISFLNKRKQKFDNYDYRDGIPIGSFIEGSACTTPDGNIFFGSLNSVCYFNPLNVNAKRKVAPVIITDCYVLGNEKNNKDNKDKLISLKNEIIELEHNQNSLKFSFSVMDYSQSQKVEYSYIIKGLDNTWYNIYNENQITFRNLPAGKYTLKVKARLKNKEWDEDQVASLYFNINPPYWLSWYAKLIYGIILCLFIFIILRLYKRRINWKNKLELEKENNRSKLILNEERLQFYTNITHELRTPLTLIQGPIEDILNEDELPEKFNSKIKLIHKSTIRLRNLINQLLEFRKVETNNKRLTVSRENLANLVSEIGLRYKELNTNNKVKISINIDSKVNDLYYDTEILTIILDNLISNAIKYTNQGEIIISLREIHENNQVFTEIEIKDTGLGIPSEEIKHIFNRYYQVKGKHQASGTGIGLSLVKSLIDTHHGKILVKSKLGEGAQFIIRLLTHYNYPDALHNNEDNQKHTVIHNKTNDNIEETDNTQVVLIVEDNDDIRDYINSSLSPKYKTYTASDGVEGLKIANQYIPNIIVSDIMMPEMNGIELCKRIKEDINTSHIPVILLTAKDSILDKQEGYENGADSYLTKPFSAQLLQTRILNLIKSREKLARKVTKQTQNPLSNKFNTKLNINKLDKQFLEKIITIIEDNLNSENFDIQYITKEVNMSQSTLYRKIKSLTGVSTNEFVRKIRLKNCLKLIKSGEYNISEAAYLTGFNDLAYFRQCFKDEYGMTPSEYSKNNI